MGEIPLGQYSCKKNQFWPKSNFFLEAQANDFSNVFRCLLFSRNSAKRPSNVSSLFPMTRPANIKFSGIVAAAQVNVTVTVPREKKKKKDACAL